MTADARLTIRDVASRTGVAVGTLRMWERRHGIPAPTRLASGHRRYGERDVELIRRIAAERDAGTPLALAVARTTRALDAAPTSLFAALRRQRPELAARTLRKATMTALSHAIEDESLSRAERPLLYASFQRERYYRHAEPRWRQLAAGAAVAAVFADFAEVRPARDGPWEIPVGAGEPLRREWAIVCYASGHAVCLAAWEPTTTDGASERDRLFEAIWSVEPGVVAQAARVCAALAAPHAPAVADATLARLEAEPAPTVADQLVLATAITGRVLSLIDGGA